MNWTLWLFIIGCFSCKYTHAQQQRVPPGVSPQHYQQPVQQVHQVPQQIPQQQFQQVPGQVPMQQVPHQQVPHQQVPHQQVHQQVPHQQVPHQQVPHQQVHQQVPVQPVQQQHMPSQHVPIQQGHGHDHPQQILNAANIAHEKAHIAEHMEVPIDTSKMTEQELQFHYFKMHDADNNNKLDGCELIKSLIHWHEQGNKEVSGANPGEKLFKDEELITLIDPILSLDDANNDGYIDYPEFIQAQQNAAPTGRQ